MLGAWMIHNVINHVECYVNGNVHTNGLEDLGSLLKRSLKGTNVPRSNSSFSPRR